MYGRSPGAFSLAETGVQGSLMGRTLGYLGLLLAILTATAVLTGGALGEVGLLAGIVMMFLGSIMVNRSAARGGRAFTWAVVTAVGMGLLLSPILIMVAASDASLLWFTLATLTVAVGFSAALVSWVPWDFTRLTPLLSVGLILLLITGFLSMLVPGLTGIQMSTTWNLIGVVIFTGYLMVDLSLMRHRRLMLPAQGAAAVLATRLLIDIVNLFLFLLRLGRR